MTLKMETLAFALVLIFILWLIDKHSLWRGFFKIILGLVVLGVVGALCLYGWIKYDAYRTEKRQAAEAAAYQAKLKACIALNTGKQGNVSDHLADAIDQVAAEETCKANPDAKPACWSKPNASGFQIDQNSEQTLEGKLIPPNPNQTCYPNVTKSYPPPPPGFIPDKPKKLVLTHLKVKSDTDLTTTEYGYLTCGHVARGEIVTLLEDSNIGVKVKTAGGQVGWAAAYAFEVVH
jgi:hypothetical protein